MALLWFDGFNSYNSMTNVLRVVSSFSGYQSLSGSYAVGAGYGRNGTRGISILSNSSFLKIFGNYTTIIIGFAIYTAAGQSNGSLFDANFLEFRDKTSSQLSFTVYGTEIRVYRGNRTALLGVSSGARLYGTTWRYIEVKATIDSSSGSVEIRVDGRDTPVLNLSGINTQATANAYLNRFYWRGYKTTGSNVYMYYDDLYICDTTGSKNNDFLGNMRVDVIRPDGAGSHTDFTPSAGSNYENVDEDYPISTDYNEGDTVGNQDSYSIGDLSAPAGISVAGVKSQISAKKTDVGDRTIKVLTVSNGSDYLGDEFSLSTSYLTPTQVYEDNPDDSADWEEADVNGIEVGVEIIS